MDEFDVERQIGHARYRGRLIRRFEPDEEYERLLFQLNMLWWVPTLVALFVIPLTGWLVGPSVAGCVAHWRGRNWKHWAPVGFAAWLVCAFLEWKFLPSS